MCVSVDDAFHAVPCLAEGAFSLLFKSRSFANTSISMTSTTEGKFSIVGIDACEEWIECANDAFAQNDVLSFAKVDISKELSSKR